MGFQEYLPETSKPGERFTGIFAWKGGLLAGFVAGVVTAVLIAVIDPGLLGDFIAGMYGMEGNVLAGAVAHVVHGTIFGLIFAAILWEPVLFFASSNHVKSLLAGLVYGLILAVTAAGIILPIWLQVVNVSQPPGVPFISTSLIVWHVAYGAVLGLLFPLVDDV